MASTPRMASIRSSLSGAGAKNFGVMAPGTFVKSKPWPKT